MVDFQQAVELAKKHLGYLGTMVGASKGRYSDKHKKNLVVFNSNVIALGGKVWYGDLDITKSLKQLQALSESLDGEPIYVLREMDGRFEYENKPRLDRFVALITPISVTLGPDHKDYYQFQGKKVVAIDREPAKVSTTEPIRLYKLGELQEVVKLPAMSTFKPASSKQSEYPYNKFYKWLKDNGFEPKNVSEVVISTKKEQELKKLVASWLKKHKMDNYDLQKNLAYLWLSDSPNSFSKQDGLKDGWAYRKTSG